MKVTFIGSALDSGYSENALAFTAELGREAARRCHTVVYGPEPKVPSLPYWVAKAARESGGLTVAIANGGARTKFYDPSVASVVVYTEGACGATREVILVNSSDVVVAIGGGSGTLTEIGIAYMNYIPVVAMQGSGGWADKVLGTYLDDRKKYIIPGAKSAVEALDLAEQMYEQYKEMPTQIQNHYGSSEK